ncbi:TPA: DUF4760 domain-containing protein [Providencia rettgeri]|nr:DUF4760 domain-containing protein [Providencia rettgeri]HEF8779592.1 DUF4760 domain-containing protein [Providencia rettgeri]
MISEYWQYAGVIAQCVSAVAVVLGAFIAIRTTTRTLNANATAALQAQEAHAETAKKTQTSIFLFESRHDQGFIDGLNILRDRNESGKSFRSYIFPCSDQSEEEKESDKEERRKIGYYLNFFERVSVSIKNGIYDETMLKEVLFNTAIKNYDIAEPFIKAIREKHGRSTYYQEYEWLVDKWKREPLKANKPH